MSKKEILESLSYRQHQDSVMLNKLFVSLARATNTKPEDLAKHFLDDAGNSEYVKTFNESIDKLVAESRATSSESLKSEGDSNTAAAVEASSV